MSDYKKGDYPLIVDPKFYFGDNITVRGSASRDLIRINDNYNTVLAGAGNDLVTLVGANNALVYGEAGDDFIGTRSASTKNPTIYGGAGKDTIRTLSDRTYADGGDGDDLFIPLESVSRTTLIGGAGNDTFWFIESSTVTASGGTGNNLYQFDPYVIVPGKFSDPNYHNDVIITDISSRDTIRYDFEASDGTELSWYESNGNIILNDSMGFFTITLQGGASKKSEIANVKYQAIDWSGTLGELFSELTVSDTQGGSKDMAESTLIANVTNSTVITGTTYADSITSYANNVTINSGAGNDTIYTGKDGNVVNSGAGNDYVETYQGTTNIKISGGDGNDSVYVGSNGATVNGDAGDDYLYVYTSGRNQTLFGGAGNDSALSGGENILIDVGEGNDYVQMYNSAKKNTITGGNGSDTIKIGGDSVIAYGDAGNDYLYVYSNAYNQTMFGGAGNDSVYSGGENVLIDTGADNDYIHLYNSAKSHTVRGGAGNDTIKSYSTLGTLFRYSSGDGNDSINGISANDTLRIENTSYSTVKSGSAMIITAGSGKITVDNGANVAFTIHGTIDNPTPDTLISNSRNNTVITGTSSADSISNSGNYVTAGGGNGNDTISNYPGNYVSMSGGAGNDNITNLYGYMVTVDGGAGNDYIYNTGESVEVYAGDGDDTIVNEGIDDVDGYGTRNSGDNVTISGGKGNDYIYGYGSKEFFLYENGDGNDTIMGIGSQDTIKISGTTYSTAKSGSDDLIVTAGSGKISVKGGANVAFTILGTTTLPPATVTLNSAKTSATILPAYEEGTFDAAAADYSKVVTIDATQATVDLEILGNAKNNKIYGSENNDTLYGGKGTDTLTGNGGADTFRIVKGEGNKVIADYTEGEDVIYVEGADVSTVINSATVKSGNVIFKVGTNNVTVKGGDGQEILFVDEDGSEYTYPNDPDPETVIFNAASTSATITAYYDEDTFDAADYSKLVTIDATEAAIDLEILGNAKNNKIYGSENNDTLYGGKGTDTLTGNGGADTFRIVKGEGNKVIADYAEGEDIIYVEGADVSTVINSATIKSGNVIFKVGTNNVTVKGGDDNCRLRRRHLRRQ